MTTKIEKLQETEKALLAEIEATDKEIEAVLSEGDWQKAAALREKKAYLAGPQLEKLKQEQQQAKLAAKRAVIDDLRRQAAQLRRGVEERDKRTAEARALIEREEGVSFDWLKDDPMYVEHPHWTNRFELPATYRNGPSLSHSELDFEKADELEADAKKLEAKLGS